MTKTRVIAALVMAPVAIAAILLLPTQWLVALVALVFLIQGVSAALAALLGGASVVLGSALAANVALGGGVVPARLAFFRLVLGTGIKWLVVITIFALALGVGRLPPLPLLAGLAVALIAYPLVLNFSVRVERER